MPIIGGRQIGVRGLGFQGAGKPNAPTSVSATDVGTARAYNNGAATVTWVAPSSNGAPITSYSVLSSPGGYTATTSSTSVQVTGLQSNTAYTFTVTATNAVGTSDASSASSSITATTVPQAPTIGTATGGNASSSITFTPLNAVSNPSLENGLTTGYAAAGATLTASTAFAYVGTYSLASTLISASDTNIAYWGGSTLPSTGNYNFSAWFYIPSASTIPNGSTVNFSYEGSNGSVTSSVPAVLQKGSWVQASAVINFTTTTPGPIVARTSFLPSAYIGQVIYSDLWSLDTSTAGGKGVYSHTMTSSPGALTATGTASPITVSGLTNGTAYTFTVTATNANGTSAASSASNSVTPIQPTYAVVGHGGSPFISAYRFTTSGFGTKYSNPATLPTSALGDVQFHPSAQAVLCAVNFGGYTLTAYGWSDSGFGTKYADTTNQNGGTAGLGCSFNPAGTVAAGANTGSPDFPAGFSAYPFSVSTGFGTMYSGPATKPFNNSTANDVAFNPAGTVVAWAVTNTGGSTVFAYPFSFSTGYGTKYADPSPGFATSAGTISFNSSSVVIGSSISPYLQAYPFSSGFGTKYADPATMPGTRVVGVAFNPAGTQVALALQDGIKLSAYPFSSGFGTKYSDYPGSGPTDAAQDVAFTSDGLTLGVAFNLSPYIRAYRFSASGFGSEYSQPASIPANNANGISFVTAA